jgi:hypothetical protein
LPDLTKRTILMLKETNPTWGCQKISDMLCRGPALPASAGAVARVLHEAGYELEEVITRPHPDHVRRFERARSNQLWQTDLFTELAVPPVNVKEKSLSTPDPVPPSVQYSTSILL